MNLALSALVLFCLLLPGMVFRYSYARGAWRWTSPVSFRSVSDELAYSLFAAVGFHFSFLALLSLVDQRVDYPTLLAVVSGDYSKDGEGLARVARVLEGSGPRVAAYFLGTCALCAVVGLSSHAVVRKRQLDLKYPQLRFENPWYYLLSGEILAVPRKGEDSAEVLKSYVPPDGVYVSAVVIVGNNPQLYWGVLRDWQLSADGFLDILIIENAHRRPFSADRTGLVNETTPDDEELDANFESTPITEEVSARASSEERFYEIQGDYIIIRYSDVSTLNLDYFWLEEFE